MIFNFSFIYFILLGDNVDCWMEIQQGKGPWASPVTGIVPLGTTLTMVVGIDDKEGTKFFLNFSKLKMQCLSLHCQNDLELIVSHLICVTH